MASVCAVSFPDSVPELVGEPEPVKRSGGQVLAQPPVQAAVVAVSGVK